MCNLAQRILQLRKERGLSQEELANDLKISRQAVSKWETSAAKPDVEALVNLSKLFDVTVDFLLTGDKAIDSKRKENKRETDRKLRFWLGIIVVGICLLLIFGFFIINPLQFDVTWASEESISWFQSLLIYLKWTESELAFWVIAGVGLMGFGNSMYYAFFYRER